MQMDFRFFYMISGIIPLSVDRRAKPGAGAMKSRMS